MTPLQLAVTVTGALLIVAIYWWFFVAPRRQAGVAARAAGGVQEMTITVHGGYSPDPVRVEAGRPVRLNFHRTETGACSEEVVLGEFNVRTFLPPHEVTPVEFTPRTPGRYTYTCGMGMLRGTLIVTGPAEVSDA